jgi:hypothetical protein
MDKQKWTSGIHDEINFWDSWFETKGLEWPEDYKFRLDPNTELQPYLKELIAGIENPTILDIGAGPLTFMGKNINGIPVMIYAVDALAAYYNLIFAKFDITPPVKTLFKESEDINQLIGLVKPDLIVAQNTLDHSYDPMGAIIKMPLLFKKSGIIYLNHYNRTADKENHLGLHQWNFYLDNNRLMLASDDIIFDVEEEVRRCSLKNISFENTYHAESNQIVTIIRINP